LKKLKYFHHVSTYAVNAYKDCEVSELEPTEDSSKLDHYARSKLQGERLVEKTNLGKVRKRIYRPGIVVGDSHTGEIEKIDGPYYFLQIIHKFRKHASWLERLGTLPIPCSKKAKLPIIPVDYLAQWLLEATVHPTKAKEVKTYHFMSEPKLNLHEFVQLCLKELEIQCTVHPVKANFISRKILQKLGIPKELSLYMFSNATYSTEQRRKDFPSHEEYQVDQIIPSLIRGSNKFFNEVDE
ncbi:MAG: SDR family oxidoreductase, partial [Bacteriovoracaceae bacterium]|nr:SDR family oxidoreductase [Bacteriovoracaceae bacterium]